MLNLKRLVSKQKIDVYFLKKLMRKLDGVILDLSGSCDIEEGWMDEGFKLRSRNDTRCAFIRKSKVKPIVGKSYRVKIGDPKYFTAKYLGVVPLVMDIELFIRKFCIDVPVSENVSSSNGKDVVCVFEQDGKYLFYNRVFTEFLREV